MKRVLVLSVSMLALMGGYAAPAAKSSLRVLRLCELVDNWEDFNRQKVLVRAILVSGAEQTWLYDPACREGAGLTDVSFQQKTKGAMRRLDQLIARDRRAWVTFEGVFYGPEPYQNIDPKLPAPIRERFEKSHKRYGHMNTFDTMIKVSKVVDATAVAADVPRSK